MPIHTDHQHDQLAADLRPLFEPKLNQLTTKQIQFYPILATSLVAGCDYLQSCFDGHKAPTVYSVRKITKQFYENIINQLTPYEIVVYQKDLPAYRQAVKQLANQLRGQLRDSMMPLDPNENRIGLYLISLMETKLIVETLAEHPNYAIGDHDWVQRAFAKIYQFWAHVKPLMTETSN